ncbi:MAG: hypothetical protein OXR66_04790 [Candidatus Woesearchaeota archaeon]|nr:hypothetical protein [Candidatus Woesearchaeota archaeon]
MNFVRVLGIYNANSGLLGELAYVVRKIAGTRDCVLCDITHKGVRKKKEWVSAEIPVELIYINEQDPKLRAFTNGKTPCIIGQTKDGYVMLITSDALRELQGDVNKFHKLLKQKLS